MSDRTGPRRLLVIANPVAGRQAFERTRGQIERALDRAGVAYRLRVTGGEGDARHWARAAEGVDRVVVSGGDGTVMEAVSGLVGRGVALAQIPTGTANLLAQALGVPSDVEEALALALHGSAVPFDVGYLPDRDRYFALVAGAGYDAQLIHDARRDLKKRLGFFAYVVSGLRNLFRLRRSEVTLELDGERQHLRAHTVMVINVEGLSSVRIGLGSHIDPHDGRLDVAVIAPEAVGGMVRLALRLLLGRHRSDADLRYLSATRLRVEADPPLRLQIDGESIGTTPLTVAAVPDGARLVVPARYRERFEAMRARRERRDGAVAGNNGGSSSS